MLETLMERLTQNRRDFIWSLLLASLSGYISASLAVSTDSNVLVTIPLWAFPAYILFNSCGLAITFFTAMILIVISGTTLWSGGKEES